MFKGILYVHSYYLKKKLEKTSSTLINRILQKHTIEKIVKLPEKTFSEGVNTSIFIFRAGIPHNAKEIFSCYIEEDGLETVKNQGRHDIKDKWKGIEDYWVDVIRKQTGDKTIQWIDSKVNLSYQTPEIPFEIFEEDFRKSIIDYYLYKNNVDSKKLNDSIINRVLYSGDLNLLNIKNGDNDE